MLDAKLFCVACPNFYPLFAFVPNASGCLDNNSHRTWRITFCIVYFFIGQSIFSTNKRVPKKINQVDMNKKILGCLSLTIAVSIWGISICFFKIKIVLLIILFFADLFFTMAIAFLGEKYVLKAKQYFKKIKCKIFTN
jgi:uncharacterized protein YacL